MQTRQFRGVPLRMQQDGWWLDAPRQTPQNRQTQRRRDGIKLSLLIALIACADLLVWDVAPGLSLAVLGMMSVAAGLVLAWPGLSPRARLLISVGTVLSVLPLIELVQPLSVLIAVSGLSILCAALAGLARHDILRGALRLWWVAPVQSCCDGARAVRGVGDLKMTSFDLRTMVSGWALPIGATVVFAMLLVGANPVLDRALSQFPGWEVPAPNLWRVWFWTVLGGTIWPILVAARMRERLRTTPSARATVRRPGIVNAESVARSMVAFNALFAVQTFMDALFLYGHVGLPEGVTAAAYAHRGAYPLLFTALLAGVFAMLARPHLVGRPVVRVLMFLWLAQTLALVFASVWRLETYVDIYGLTRLRLSAYIWMGLVASGLCIVTWQIWKDRPAVWMLARSGALGAATLYVCAFVNFDGIIATHNLTQPVQQDIYALCQLSEGALPALARHWHADPVATCKATYWDHPQLFRPQDWREWGFRNWRVRLSLDAMTYQATAS